MRCPICNRKHKNGGVYCHGCQIALDKDKAEEQRQRNLNHNAVKFLQYQGHVIGFFKKSRDLLIARYIGMGLSGIPKSKLINLDEYVPGFDRDQIKRFKSTVLKLSQA